MADGDNMDDGVSRIDLNDGRSAVYKLNEDSVTGVPSLDAAGNA